MKAVLMQLLAAMLITTSAAFAEVIDYKPNEIIVKFKEGVRRTRATMEGLYTAAGVVKVKRFQGSRLLEQLIVADGVDIKTIIQQLQESPYVEFAEPNYILRALPIETSVASGSSNIGGGIPCIPGIDIPGCDPDLCIIPNFPPGCKDGGGGDPGDPEPPKGRPPVADRPEEVLPGIADPGIDQAYGLGKIGASGAWRKHRGSQETVVAVIDTGVDYNHEDLAFNMWRNPEAREKGDIVGWDFVHNDNLPFDDHSHGTHCAGSVGAVGENGKGLSGVSQRVSIMALKFLGSDGSGDEAGAIRAIDYAVQNGAKILSNSWGGRADAGGIKGLRDAVLRAESKGVLVIAAAGNDGSNNDRTPTYPASLKTENMIAVAATDRNDGLAYFSNTGKNSVHVAAPGVDVFSTIPGNKYQKMSGTSMACPHVAGAAALVWSAEPSLSYKQVKQRLMESADPLPALKGKTISGGRINVARAIGTSGI